ncbi:MAG: hypothetical protein D3903_11105 [Candidatus Electrothrix sp. GM3_4]|nr:hypothetical protein [Candidatus Electrothrix sp. GM3_4]
MKEHTKRKVITITQKIAYCIGLLGLITGTAHGGEETVLVKYSLDNIVVPHGDHRSYSLPDHGTTFAATVISEQLSGGTAPDEFGVQNVGLVRDGVYGDSSFSHKGGAFDRYYEFTMYRFGGKPFKLTSVEANLGVGSGVSYKTQREYLLYWDVDGFSAPIARLVSPLQSPSVRDTEELVRAEILAAEAPRTKTWITFRLVPKLIHGHSGDLNRKVGWFDNLSINGITRLKTTIPLSDQDFKDACNVYRVDGPMPYSNPYTSFWRKFQITDNRISHKDEVKNVDITAANEYNKPNPDLYTCNTYRINVPILATHHPQRLTEGGPWVVNHRVYGRKNKLDPFRQLCEKHEGVYTVTEMSFKYGTPPGGKGFCSFRGEEFHGIPERLRNPFNDPDLKWNY